MVLFSSILNSWQKTRKAISRTEGTSVGGTALLAEGIPQVEGAASLLHFRRMVKWDLTVDQYLLFFGVCVFDILSGCSCWSCRGGDVRAMAWVHVLHLVGLAASSGASGLIFYLRSPHHRTSGA